MEARPDRDALIALLDFFEAAGVDLALDETPHDRFAEGMRAHEARQPAPSAEPPLLVPARSADAIAADARAQAAQARTLNELRALLDAFEGCSLKSTARQLVFADGVPGSRVMLLGEAPGAEEDRSGRPFMGRAGQLLDRMLAAVGLDRGSVYIANVVPWRPPGNRTPTPQEVATCLPFTLRQIELAAPEILVTLGAPATQLVLGIKAGITATRGRWHDGQRGGVPMKVLPMLHPAYLLRTPLHKRYAWLDLRALRRELDRTAGQHPSLPEPSDATRT